MKITNLKRAFLPVFGPKSSQNRQNFSLVPSALAVGIFHFLVGDVREKKAFLRACDWRGFTITVQYMLRVQTGKVLIDGEALRVLHNIGLEC